MMDVSWTYCDNHSTVVYVSQIITLYASNLHNDVDNYFSIKLEKQINKQKIFPNGAFTPPHF